VKLVLGNFYKAVEFVDVCLIETPDYTSGEITGWNRWLLLTEPLGYVERRLETKEAEY